MNYYIQGNAANADKIRAAFEKLGYNVKGWRFTSGIYYTLNGKIINTNFASNEYKLVLNNPDYKELELPKPHYDISNFNPFDKVLVRCSNDEEWMIEFYCKYDTLVHTSPHRDYPFMGIGDSYSQCIPFEGNEHLFGTTDICDEMYINW